MLYLISHFTLVYILRLKEKLFMNKIYSLLIASLLILSGCRQAIDTTDSSSRRNSVASSAQAELSSQSEASEEQKEALPQVDSKPAEQSSDQINSATALIPGGDRLLASSQGLFLLKEYGLEMKWMEANQIENLDRGTPVTDQGTYFLFLPKYQRSLVEVQRLEWNGTDFVPVETLYHNENTPDSYGLILTSDEPEASANLRVTVTYGKEQSSRTFSYDGRGDRPAVMVFPGDERWWEN